MKLTRRQQAVNRYEALKAERNSWLDHWRELADYIQPRRARFTSTDRNKTRRNDKIINSAPRRAARVLASGMMAGVTSPARPWFRLTTPDAALANFGRVRNWLYAVEQSMRLVYARSNIYNVLHGGYLDLGTFAVAAMHIDEDLEDVVRGYNYPVGQFCLANSPRLAVNTVYRELSMTVMQLVEQFGYDNVSATAREFYDRGDYDQWVEVLHIIEPNKGMDTGKWGPAGMPFVSLWLELGRSDVEGLLRVKGYNEFPVLCPRWEVVGEDIYGSSSPGIDALGDCKALQTLERRKAQMVDKTVSPPMKGPASLMSRRVSLLPGDFTAVDGTDGNTLAPAVVMPPQAFSALQDMIKDHEERIGFAYFSDLWLMMAETDRREITAREVAERHEEKMLQLGPVMERLQDELLDPLIDRTFGIMLRSGQLPPPPPELFGVDLRVEYISILAQAQKLIGTSAIERFSSYVVQAATARPDVLDIVDWDKAAREYGDALGVAPTLFMAEDAVAQIRAERAQQQEQARRVEQAEQGTQALRNASQADPENLQQLSDAYGAQGLIQ